MKEKNVENTADFQHEVERYFYMRPQHPKLGKRLDADGLYEMLVGTPFYTYSNASGLQLRIKKMVDGRDLLCMTEQSCHIVRLKFENQEKSWFAFAAELPKTVGENQKVFSVISWGPNIPETVSMQCYENKEAAEKAMDVSVETCRRMAGGEVTRDIENNKVALRCSGGEYFWRLMEQDIHQNEK